jgi:carbon-monoxide dehydrogenase medium subunit
MIPRFALARPTSLPEAFAAFAATDGDGAFIAGGTELLQVMKMGFAQFGTLVDLKGLPELRGIGLEPDGRLRIGAATTHREIERAEIVGRALPGLVALERGVANVRVRSTGTLGGNLAFAEPHSDPATFLLVCDATVELAGPGGRRELSISDFVLGPLATGRDPEEILTAIRIPARRPGEGRGYAKVAFFERPAASVGVRLRVDGGSVIAAAVAVGSLTEMPQLVPAAGELLVGVPADDAALERAITGPPAAAVFDALDCIEDLNGSADYKRHLATTLLARAARGALAEARLDG